MTMCPKPINHLRYSKDGTNTRTVPFSIELIISPITKVQFFFPKVLVVFQHGKVLAVFPKVLTVF